MEAETRPVQHNRKLWILFRGLDIVDDLTTERSTLIGKDLIHPHRDAVILIWQDDQDLAWPLIDPEKPHDNNTKSNPIS
ncbi:hypothetical protein N7532_011904 [Penicillium argentinense]|uniref:Uncharacterized protein n=1 Tax=Penicillium argentinense TaxID=1131581 RepID=A0A9W9JVG3_9EURO|nr:uncharacterized protein N7532_011904 [Penicillium argentinense]KAJ5082861.1 hypothetical protein N7532_011904 [Penicillium argentinense]